MSSDRLFLLIMAVIAVKFSFDNNKLFGELTLQRGSFEVIKLAGARTKAIAKAD